MGRSRNASLNGAQIMVDMQALQDVLNAFHQAHKRMDGRELEIMIHHYDDPSNPVRKLINQYNAAVDLTAQPVEGSA